MAREPKNSKAKARLIAAVVGAFAVVGFTAGAHAEDPPKGGTLTRSVNTGSVQSSPAKGAPKDWKQEAETSCGMACRYHRANDNLTMQALYLVTKIGKIESELAKKDPNTDSVRTALGAFCKSTTEDVGDCFNRYKAFQRVGLLEIRQAIGKNEDTIARLTNGRKLDGSVEGTALVYETGEERIPYMPDVPTLSELETSYLEGKLKPHGTTYSREEVQKWSQSLVLSDPKGKFLQFNPKTVQGNPYQEDKSTYSLYMQKVDSDGKGTDDAKLVGMHAVAQKTIEDFAKDQKKEIESGKIKVVAPTKNLKKEDAISYEAFVQARSVVNSKIDADATKSDQVEKDRKVASEKDPKPKPSATPSGTPVVESTNTGVSRDVKVTTGGSARRAPTGMKTYLPDEKVERPAEMKNSRYIKYDLGDMLNDIENSTK